MDGTYTWIAGGRIRVVSKSDTYYTNGPMQCVLQFWAISAKLRDILIFPCSRFRETARLIMIISRITRIVTDVAASSCQ
eukprot:scaffold108198_cov30-Prasinocladus_malaysianus.AAC.1